MKSIEMSQNAVCKQQKNIGYKTQMTMQRAMFNLVYIGNRVVHANGHTDDDPGKLPLAFACIVILCIFCIVLNRHPAFAVLVYQFGSSEHYNWNGNLLI